MAQIRDPEPVQVYKDPAHATNQVSLVQLANGELLLGFNEERGPIHADSGQSCLIKSADGGRTWGEPRFVFANALAPVYEVPFMNHQCSYIDAFVDDGVLNIFVPHRWRQALHLRLPEASLPELPTSAELF